MRAIILLAGLLLSSSIQAQLVPDIRIDGDNPAGVRSDDIEIAASDDSVYVFWKDERNGKENVFFNRSTDGGRNWLSKSQPVPGARDVGRFRVAVSDDAVCVVWKKKGGGLYCNRSENQGKDWFSGPQLVTATLETEELEVAVSDQFLYVVWRERDSDSRRWDIYFRSSPNRGQTWASNPKRLDTDHQETGDSLENKIAVSGDAVYVVWEDGRDGPRDIYFNRSLDHGATWLQNDVRVDRAGFSSNRADSKDPAIAAVGNSVYVVWEDERRGMADIYFNVSTDFGNPTTWLGSDKRLETDTPGADVSNRTRIAASGDAVYVTWEHQDPSQEIHFNRSTNNGRSWAGVTRLSTVPGKKARAEITASGNSVYVAWHLITGVRRDIEFNRSLDRGKTWLPSDIRLNTGSPTNRAYSISPVMAASGDSVYVAWEDERNGARDRDVYFNVAHAPVLPYGVGLAGSGGFVPKIGTDGVDPQIGNPFQIVVKDALGGTLCLIAMSLDRVEAPFPGGRLYGDFFTPGRSFGLYLNTSGPSFVPGRGEAVFVFPIPNDPSLLERTFYWQGFVADGGSSGPAGVSHTGGLATTPIR